MEIIIFVLVLSAFLVAIHWVVNGEWRRVDVDDEEESAQEQTEEQVGTEVAVEEEHVGQQEDVDTDKRVVYHLVPYKGDWAIKRSRKVVETYDTKAEALKGGRALAKSHKKGQLIVHKKDGTIQEEFTYGEDPRSSKG